MKTPRTYQVFSPVHANWIQSQGAGIQQLCIELIGLGWRRESLIDAMQQNL
jgi:hypothetical protein